MHQLLRPHDAPAKGRAYGLVAQAHAQNRPLAGKVAYRLHRDAGFGRRARTRRDHQTIKIDGRQLRHAELIIAHHLHLGTELTEVLDDVVGKAVVVVDHQHAQRVLGRTHCRPSSTNSLARSRARALASVSFHSSSGTESATTPAAACTYRVWFLMMPVRIAIATSMSPA